VALTTHNTGALVSAPVIISQGEIIMAEKLASYTIIRPCLIGGERKEISTVVQMEPGEGNYIVALGKAVKGEQKLATKKEEKK
jgi:hypothetical protein